MVRRAGFTRANGRNAIIIGVGVRGRSAGESAGFSRKRYWAFEVTSRPLGSARGTHVTGMIFLELQFTIPATVLTICA